MDSAFPAHRLTGLEVGLFPQGTVQRTLQTLDRVSPWHVVTLKPGLSTSQTDELGRRDRRLDVPRPLHSTLRADQRAELMDVGGFLSLVRGRQAA